MTITALLDLTLTPESLEEAPAIIDQVLTQTRAFEGCLGLEVLQDETDPTRVMVIERWDSPESDAAYRAWRATPEGTSSLGSILAAAPTLVKYTTLSEK
ncbi:putative quinol monooxygenase [Glaciihabitans sp. dw_435]|uniref:putative quinol monooxygenase n=1 Tax=Glaciihabitans sp. dw_435 TaxID=2720081 RepID=UPI001BD5C990|nr:antibiotic biosynthesis monooxygenase family protein [Glaciihabitans sp. dw_435]